MTKDNNLPNFTIRQLLEAGVHFGHKTSRRNTKMSKYIYGVRNGISIMDLQQTANFLYNSLKIVKDIAKNNGRILFVATKKQAYDTVAEAAKRCGQYYVNHRWLGGMLTNWKTVSASIKTLKKIEEQLADEELGLNKKEKLVLERQRQKLEATLGGIKNMGGYPDLVFVIDTHRESLAVAEAKKLGVPLMAVLDSNSNPDGILYPIPGNDDSVKAIKLYCRLLSDAILAGIRENMAISGVDLSKLEGASAEEILETAKKSQDKKSFDDKKSKTAKKELDKKPAKKAVEETTSEEQEVSEDEGKKTEAKKPSAKNSEVKKPAAKKSEAPKKAGPKKK